MQLNRYCLPWLQAIVVCLSVSAGLAIAGCGATGPVASSVQRTLSTVSVTPATVDLAPGATQQFVATATYSDGSTSDVSATATWVSSNPAIVTVNAGGKATGVIAGSATIAASMSGVTAKTASVTVAAAPTPAPATLKSIAISPNPASVAAGNTQAFAAVATYSDGTTADITSTAVWTTSNAAIATVSPSGVATGVSAGSTTITASLNSATASATLNVAAPSACSGSGSGYNNQNGAITGVWMQSPSPGQNSSQVQVNATAYGPITQWAVCLDDQPVYQANNAASSISQGIDIPAGQHLLYARAWDAQGDSNRSEVKLIQVGPPPPSSTVLPTPPAGAQVLTEMQNDTADWSICSLCAHGTNTTGNYWMAPFQNQPSLSGSSLEMYADGPSWTNVLFTDTMSGTSSNSHFLWDFWVYHDAAAETHFWSSEFDLWQVLGGREFMIGSQCDFGDGYWSTWDSQGNRWVLNGIPCPHWAPGWHHVQWYVERINPTQYRYDTLVFDGQAYGLNQTWTINSTAWQDMIGIQYQLDQDSTGTPLHEWVDHVSLTMW